MSGSKLTTLLVLAIMAIFAYFVIKWTNSEITSLRSGASSSNSLEAESGTTSGSVSVADDTSASGGKYVSFTPRDIVQNQPSLLESYIVNSTDYLPRADDPTRVEWVIHEGWYGQMLYQPRKFVAGNPTGQNYIYSGIPFIVANPGVYNGWDIFSPAYNGYIRIVNWPKIETLTLNRPAKLAIVWIDSAAISKNGLPNWMVSQGWTKSSQTVSLTQGTATATYPTYTKSVPAGEVVLGGIQDTDSLPRPSTSDIGQLSYLVLIGETDGTPSKEPSVPQGLEKPLANQTCPTWVHDQYVTTGPDGKTYPTWHPKIDPVFWCYFRHEHGDNPDNFVKGYKVAYNYTALHNQASGEPHVGFKTLVFSDATGNTWLLNVHIGTGGLARVCTRFHSMDIAVRRTNDPNSPDSILADVHLMGDFGQAVANATGQLLQPPSCPTQGVGVPTRGAGAGQRQIPVHSLGQDGYEPWVSGAIGNILGLGTGWDINTHNSMVVCDTAPDCANPYVTGADGTRRFFADADHLKIVAGSNIGTFYTNTVATQLISSTDPSALKQYIKPGMSAIYPSDGTKCVIIQGWGRPHQCYPLAYLKDGKTINNFANDIMRGDNQENSIQVPN